MLKELVARIQKTGAASPQSLFGKRVYQFSRQLIADSLNGGNETVDREWQVARNSDKGNKPC
jgi:hypothetical protein